MTHYSDDTLFEYLDETIPNSLQGEIDVHLAACSECATRLAELRVLFARIESLPEVALKKDLAPRIITQLKTVHHLPQPVGWLALLQTVVAILAAIQVKPYWEALTGTARLPLIIPSLEAISSRLVSTSLDLARSLSLVSWKIEIPPIGLDLPAITLIPALISASLLWIVGNGLLLIPNNRRR